MQPAHPRRTGRFLRVAVLLLAAGYVPSSGPVLATAFWLRERTGRDEFYAAMWPYLPLLRPAGSPVKDYIEWWVIRFGTVGPG